MKLLKLCSLVSLAAIVGLLVSLNLGAATASPVAAAALRGANTIQPGLDDNSKHHYPCYGCLCGWTNGHCDNCCCHYDESKSALSAFVTRTFFGLDAAIGGGEDVDGGPRSFHPRDGCAATKVGPPTAHDLGGESTVSAATTKRAAHAIEAAHPNNGLTQRTSSPFVGAGSRAVQQDLGAALREPHHGEHGDTVGEHSTLTRLSGIGEGHKATTA